MGFERTEELKGYFGDDFSKQIISYKGNHWFIKQKNEQEKKRDFLAYYLGKQWTNIAEVNELEEDIKTIISHSKILSNFNEQNTWLVRIGQNYPVERTLHKDIDQAVATELVFSLWFRRRDTHSYNRVYSDEIGVPIFFDHQTTFLGEKNLQSITDFFNPKKYNAGYASVWRLRTKDNLTLSTQYVRDYEQKKEMPLTIHFVNDIQNTLMHIKETVDFIMHHDFKFKEMIEKAGFKDEEGEKIFEFIEKNRATLKEDSLRMMDIITST